MGFILPPMVSLCPNCWGLHDDSRYTCAFTYGYYTCGSCSSRYTMPLFRSKEDVMALDKAAKLKAKELYGEECGDLDYYMNSAGVRNVLRSEGWTWPESTKEVSDGRPRSSQ